MRKAIALLTVATLAAGSVAQPLAAQDRYQPDRYQSSQSDRPSRFEEGYRAGYRSGFDTARRRGQYNDRPPQVLYDGNAGGEDRGQRWRRRYQQSYTYNDDSYYRECRQSPDPAGVLAGALIGGLLGNSVGRGGGRGGATAAGVIIGGALGAGLTSNLNCQDRSYAYKTYYDGFNSGRANSDWQWENPDNGNYGDFRVGRYYNDQDGFRCATYTQQVYVRGRPAVDQGYACQQPDGTWAVVG
jgi:surface antigen